MDILKLKEETEEFLSTATIDDYYFDKNLSFLRDHVVSKLGPEVKSVEDQFLIDYFISEYKKALKEVNKDERIKAVNYLCKLILNGRIGTPARKNRIEFNINYWDEERKERVISLFSVNNSAPANWKKRVIEVLSHRYTEFSGSYVVGSYYEGYHENLYSRHEGLVLQEDLISLLSAKLAIEKNEHIISSNNEIIVGVSGGLAMKIQIRERSKIHVEDETTFKLYHFHSYDSRFEKFTVLYQEGYTNSEIKVKFSAGFYFVTPELAIEINFFPSSLLLEGTHLFKAVEDIPSLDLIEDEDQEQRRLAEDD